MNDSSNIKDVVYTLKHCTLYYTAGTRMMCFCNKFNLKQNEDVLKAINSLNPTHVRLGLNIMKKEERNLNKTLNSIKNTRCFCVGLWRWVFVFVFISRQYDNLTKIMIIFLYMFVCMLLLLLCSSCRRKCYMDFHAPHSYRKTHSCVNIIKETLSKECYTVIHVHYIINCWKKYVDRKKKLKYYIQDAMKRNEKFFFSTAKEKIKKFIVKKITNIKQQQKHCR